MMIKLERNTGAFAWVNPAAVAMLTPQGDKHTTIRFMGEAESAKTMTVVGAPEDIAAKLFGSVAG